MKKENLIAKIEEVEKADNPDENEIEGLLKFILEGISPLFLC